MATPIRLMLTAVALVGCSCGSASGTQVGATSGSQGGSTSANGSPSPGTSAGNNVVFSGADFSGPLFEGPPGHMDGRITALNPRLSTVCSVRGPLAAQTQNPSFAAEMASAAQFEGGYPTIRLDIYNYHGPGAYTPGDQDPLFASSAGGYATRIGLTLGASTGALPRDFTKGTGTITVAQGERSGTLTGDLQVAETTDHSILKVHVEGTWQCDPGASD